MMQFLFDTKWKFVYYPHEQRKCFINSPNDNSYCSYIFKRINVNKKIQKEINNQKELEQALKERDERLKARANLK